MERIGGLVFGSSSVLVLCGQRATCPTLSGWAGAVWRLVGAPERSDRDLGTRLPGAPGAGGVVFDAPEYTFGFLDEQRQLCCAGERERL
nr:hypothetical protein [Rhodococcus sp. 06-621-2]